MSHEQIQEREQAAQQYCEHITRVCADIDHNHEERPSGYIRQEECAYDVMQGVIGEQV